MGIIKKDSIERSLKRLGIEKCFAKGEYKRFGVTFSLKAVPKAERRTRQQQLSHIIRLADATSCRPLVGRFLGDKQIRKNRDRHRRAT